MPIILVIEDEQSIREVIREMLGTGKYTVLTAADGEEGLTLAREETPDAILCDISMPKYDGFQVLEQVREDPDLRTVPFLFLTGSDERRNFRKGMELGADDFIPKPFSRTELYSALQTQIQKHEERVTRFTRELQEKEEELNRLMREDELTGLPNRLALQEKFNEMLAAQQDDKALAVFSLSLDRFSYLNDSLGHEETDHLLQIIAERLTEMLDESDTVARVQAAEFALLCAKVDAGEEANEIAEEILDVVSKPITLDAHEIRITGSLGIAFHPQHGTEVMELLECAGLARSMVRTRNGDDYKMYSEEIESISSQRIAMESALRNALANDEFQVYYQPFTRASDGTVTGAEALIRWQNDSMGFVSPAEFIPVAEESGLISDIGWWVFKTASKQLGSWTGANGNSFALSVNLSGTQFGEADLVERMEEELRQEDVQPHSLKVEITETALIQDEDRASTVLDGLREKGIRIAIDDFGTGYSSFSYLQRFPFDTLKIDQSFVRNIQENRRNMEITRSIVKMAHNLDISVIAEGVETEDERDFLKEIGCDELQGFLFKKPVPADEFEEYLFSTEK